MNKTLPPLAQKLKTKMDETPLSDYFIFGGLPLTLIYFVISTFVNPTVFQKMNTIPMLAIGVSVMALMFTLSILGGLVVILISLILGYQLRNKIIDKTSQFIAQVFLRDQNIPEEVANRIFEHLNILMNKEQNFKTQEQIESLQNQVQTLSNEIESLKKKQAENDQIISMKSHTQNHEDNTKISQDEKFE